MKKKKTSTSEVVLDGLLLASLLAGIVLAAKVILRGDSPRTTTDGRHWADDGTDKFGESSVA